jgi:acetyl esterase/lipase
MEYDQQQDVVYGYKDGMALVMDVYTPKESPNGTGIIWVAMGAWQADLKWRRNALALGPGKTSTNLQAIGEILQSLYSAGYVIFAVQHSTQPRYTIDDLRPDIPRAVRHIRHHAKDFGIHPQRIGIIGGSSGGHISLMTATDVYPPNHEAEDPVDRVSSAIQAVVAYFPVTDLVNFGSEDTTHEAHCINIGYRIDGFYDFRQYNEESRGFKPVIDPGKRLDIIRQVSPITHISSTTAPVLLIHGDQDDVVPLQQSETFAAHLKEVNVEHKLIVIPGLGHEWPPPPENGQEEVLNWFEQHLLGQVE